MVRVYLAISLVLVFLVQANNVLAQIEFEESFDNQPLAKENWNFCQTAKSLNSQQAGDSPTPNTAYGFGINKALGEPKCKCISRNQRLCRLFSARNDRVEDEPDEEKPLLPAPGLSINNSCTNYDTSRIPAFKKLQKNELRLWKEVYPKANIGYWYSFRFKIDGEIDHCGSMRWIGGQIKAFKMDNSPFIAQRFDNGVFHITIEDPLNPKGKRRMIIAKAKGALDLGSRYQPDSKGETLTCDLSNGSPKPPSCRFSGLITPSGNKLPSIETDKWINMDYYVRMARPCDIEKTENCDRLLEVWAQGKKIVTVKGRFGAEKAHQALLNFKIGVYRDLQAGNAGIVIDHLILRRDPNKKWSPDPI